MSSVFDDEQSTETPDMRVMTTKTVLMAALMAMGIGVLQGQAPQGPPPGGAPAPGVAAAAGRPC